MIFAILVHVLWDGVIRTACICDRYNFSTIVKMFSILFFTSFITSQPCISEPTEVWRTISPWMHNVLFINPEFHLPCHSFNPSGTSLKSVSDFTTIHNRISSSNFITLLFNPFSRWLLSILVSFSSKVDVSEILVMTFFYSKKHLYLLQILPMLQTLHCFFPTVLHLFIYPLASFSIIILCCFSDTYIRFTDL